MRDKMKSAGFKVSEYCSLCMQCGDIVVLSPSCQRPVEFWGESFKNLGKKNRKRCRDNEAQRIYRQFITYMMFFQEVAGLLAEKHVENGVVGDEDEK